MFKNLQLRNRALWRPEMYHGWGHSQRYFEGWYIKCVSADARHAIAFIPGISMGQNGEQHAFVQVMFGSENRAVYHRYPVEAFRPDEQQFDLQVGESRFSANGIELNLPDVKGQLRFSNLAPWPNMLGAPGIMGWYSFVPFMECFHGVVSMNHDLEGILEWNGQRVDFGGGKGYLEKDWGRSFPKGYVWMQSNHFGADVPASLLASVAHIPFLGSHFIGFISGFWLDGRLFRFATYTGARKHLRIEEDTVELVFKNPKTELRLHARQAPGVALASPMSGEMTGKINESLQAHIHAELWENGQRIFEAIGHPAGLEVSLPADQPNILAD